MKRKKVAILMATYNGEKYIKEQLDSILNQSFKNWSLYISDDISSDNTLNILKEYKKKIQELSKFGLIKGYMVHFLTFLMLSEILKN